MGSGKLRGKRRYKQLREYGNTHRKWGQIYRGRYVGDEGTEIYGIYANTMYNTTVLRPLSTEYTMMIIKYQRVLYV